VRGGAAAGGGVRRRWGGGVGWGLKPGLASARARALCCQARWQDGRVRQL
jgi:hypothetical protein